MVGGLMLQETKHPAGSVMAWVIDGVAKTSVYGNIKRPIQSLW